jgi:hypothetical protein
MGRERTIGSPLAQGFARIDAIDGPKDRAAIG